MSAWIHDPQHNTYYNHSTIYAKTGIAHADQIEKCLLNALFQIKELCNNIVPIPDFRINHVRDHDGNYLQHAYIDISHPLYYYALVGCHHLIELDPSCYTNQIQKLDQHTLDFIQHRIQHKISNPLVEICDYTLDDEQHKILSEQMEYIDLKITLCPAFVKYPNDIMYNPKQLYVNNIPNDIKFIKTLFNRYTMPGNHIKVSLHQMKKGQQFALINFDHWQEASFALCMNKKITVMYDSKTLVIMCRHSQSKNKRQGW